MDDNVEKIKKLLENGYKIIRKEMKIDKIKGHGDLEHKITLKKGEDRQVILSVNSREFMEYILHFKQAKDKYDNAEFVYVEDLDKYNKFFNSLASKSILQDYHKLIISGREFSKGIVTVDIKPSGIGNEIGTAQMMIELEKNPDFKKIDFKDEVEIHDNSNKVVLRGNIKNYHSTKNTGFLSIQDLSLKMQSEKITAEFNYMNANDMMGLLAESAGFTFRTEVRGYNVTPRDFKVIVPIQNLIIDQTFNIGDVEFYQDFTDLDDALIRKSKLGRTNPLWNGNLPRAKIQVKARQFFEAIIKGYEAICKALDVISFRTDWTFPSIELNDKEIFLLFSYYKYLSRVKGSTLVYCREAETKAHTFFNIESIVENILSFDIDSQEYFTPANELFDSILKKNELTEEESRILQVLHWIRKSIQEGNKEDKFLDLWVAFEFLTSGTSIPKLFKKEEISRLKKSVEELGGSKDQLKAITFRIDQLNEPSQMAIFNHLISTLGVEFTQKELEILSMARKKRTQIIHGKKEPDIKVEELNKMRTILEKVLIKKISALKSIKEQTKQNSK